MRYEIALNGILILGFIAGYAILISIVVTLSLVIFIKIKRLWNLRYDTYALAILVAQRLPVMTRGRLDQMYEIAKEKLEIRENQPKG